ncbi:MAG: succinate dehydrogenase, hydrophobic membrane anchor protein [Shimia sp.]
MQRYITDRKRAVGLGASHAGTEHHWKMVMSSMAIVLAAPIFMITFALGYQGGAEGIAAYFGQPIIAIIMAVTGLVILRHVMFEAIEAIEDYIHGAPGQLATVGVTWLTYILGGVWVFSLARLAL